MRQLTSFIEGEKRERQTRSLDACHHDGGQQDDQREDVRNPAVVDLGVGVLHVPGLGLLEGNAEKLQAPDRARIRDGRRGEGLMTNKNTRHYSIAEMKDRLRLEITDEDHVRELAYIFTCYPFLQLKGLAAAIRDISKGKPLYEKEV
jgi:hypothetical protein